MKINKESIKKFLLALGKILILIGGGAVGGSMVGIAVVGSLAGYVNPFEMFM